MIIQEIDYEKKENYNFIDMHTVSRHHAYLCCCQWQEAV